jgi:3-methyladenine DNA glycosylase AlkD
MTEYTKKLIKLLKQNSNPNNAAPMKKYMRNMFEYFGIKTPQRRELLKKFINENGLPEMKELEKVLFELFSEPQRELHYCAMEILWRTRKEWTKGIIKLLEKLIVTNSWWDTVDAIAAGSCGYYYKQYPEQIEKVTGRWIKSKNMWLNRSSIIFQLGYGMTTDTDLLFKYILMHTESKEFFIQKAIGWALRQYSWKNPESVKNFIIENKDKLKPLSIREGSKRIKNFKVQILKGKVSFKS